MEIRIRAGRSGDAPFLARVVMEAVGAELILGLAETPERLPLVRELFTVLAARDDSQYSYRNAFVAVDESEMPVGGIIAYDGGRLHELRRAFIEEANRLLGWNVTEEEAEQWGDEADSGEIYIDSLFVEPPSRRLGIAKALMKEVEDKFTGSDKPLGLLVEPENERAQRVYRHRGFREAGISNFFYTPMIHMQRPTRRQC